jgi:hypothetical protein
VEEALLKEAKTLKEFSANDDDDDNYYKERKYTIQISASIQAL